MAKRLLGWIFIWLLAAMPVMAQSARDVTGLWFMYDLNAKKPSGIIQIYEFNGKIYGKTLLSYEDDGTVRTYRDSGLDGAKYLAGNPPMLGLDVIFGLTWDERKGRYSHGSIMKNVANKSE